MPLSHQDLVEYVGHLEKTVRLMQGIMKLQQYRIDFLLRCHDLRQKSALDELEEMGTAAETFNFDFEKTYCSSSKVKTPTKSKQ